MARGPARTTMARRGLVRRVGAAGQATRDRGLRGRGSGARDRGPGARDGGVGDEAQPAVRVGRAARPPARRDRAARAARRKRRRRPVRIAQHQHPTPDRRGRARHDEADGHARERGAGRPHRRGRPRRRPPRRQAPRRDARRDDRGAPAARQPALDDAEPPHHAAHLREHARELGWQVEFFCRNLRLYLEGSPERMGNLVDYSAVR